MKIKGGDIIVGQLGVYVISETGSERISLATGEIEELITPGEWNGYAHNLGSGAHLVDIIKRKVVYKE